MDVTPPRAAEPTPTAPLPDTPKPAAPAEQNLGPREPPADQADEPEQLINEDTTKPAVAKPPKARKNPGNGVGMIIFVTFLVMIILAGLAIYAYSQSK